jgi:C1A family cysteine protease
LIFLKIVLGSSLDHNLELGIFSTSIKSNGNLDAYDEYPDGHPRKAGHAIALIGYTQDRFIVRNSWGTKLGDNGYGYASLAYAQTAFTEAWLTVFLFDNDDR